MLTIMRDVLSLVIPLFVVIGGSPFASLEHGGPLVQTPTAAAGATSPSTVVSLFNGKDLSGWKPDVPQRDADPNGPPSFVVRDGKLVSLGKPEGHLVTDGRYRDYRLEVEYRFPGKPGNCGVLVHASKPRALYKMFPQSIEVQMMSGNAGDFWVIREDIKANDMEKRRPRKPGEQWGSTEGDARRILNLTDGSEKPLGEWNRMVIEARGRTIKVWLNGDFVNDGFDATRGSRPDRPAGRGRRGRVPQGGDRSAVPSHAVVGWAPSAMRRPSPRVGCADRRVSCRASRCVTVPHRPASASTRSAA